MTEWLAPGDDPLQWVTIYPPSQSHIIIKDQADCGKCKIRPCTYICPSQVYVWRDLVQKMEVRYTRCMECGACLIACPDHISVEWPSNGAGVQYGAWHR